jgi:hypothetical protein
VGASKGGVQRTFRVTDRSVRSKGISPPSRVEMEENVVPSEEMRYPVPMYGSPRWFQP